MASTLTWLDSSADEQRRMRELLNLFTQAETLDELGIGQMRDTFSNLLFPGTSTLLTRARYLVIVPWCHMLAEGRGLTAEGYEARVEKHERRFIKWMREAGSPPGLIGRDSGPSVKTLPSALYANALATYGIRVADQPRAATGVRYDGSGELTERYVGMWHATMPQPPEGFPKHLEGGLDLTRDEAIWIQDRILDTQRESLLGQLLLSPELIREDSAAPWLEPASGDASADSRRILEHARLFSTAIHGAHLLYNLMVAEQYEDAGFDGVEAPVERYRGLREEWSDDIRNDPTFQRWDREALWEMLITANPRVGSNVMARQFVAAWLDAVISGDALARENGAGVDDGRLRGLIAARERHVKRNQARLASRERLKAWSGNSGAGYLVFRWTQVRRIIRDIQVGIRSGASDVAS